MKESRANYFLFHVALADMAVVWDLYLDQALWIIQKKTFKLGKNDLKLLHYGRKLVLSME